MTEPPKYLHNLRAMLATNCSHIFLTPLVIGNPLWLRNAAKKMGMINAFLDDINYEGKVNNPVFILFKPTDLGRFELFLEGEKVKGKKLVDNYEYPGGYIMLVYNVEETLSADYVKVLLGRYSELSDTYKKALPPPYKFVMNAPEYASLKDKILEAPIVWSILKKKEVLLKDWIDLIGELPGNRKEYWRKPDMSKEFFDWNEYKKMPEV